MAPGPPVRAIWVTAGKPVVMLPVQSTVFDVLVTRELVVVADSSLTGGRERAHLVLPPPPGVKSDFDMTQGLAARVGL